MTEREFWIALGRIGATTEMDGEEFGYIVARLISLLDSTDQDDYFGTQGWRYHFGWEQ